VGVSLFESGRKRVAIIAGRVAVTNPAIKCFSHIAG
jgi:hypothetical protein